MSDVSIEDISSSYNQIGLINRSHQDAYKFNNSLSLLIDNSVYTNESLIQEWIKASIDCLLPEIFIATSEKLVPQMLNLDINEFSHSISNDELTTLTKLKALTRFDDGTYFVNADWKKELEI